jgi:ABC-type transport system involved in multi-copper enzyme maturation permease subunit
MITGTITPYRSDMRAGRDGFAQLLLAEWTKFKTVRSWVIGVLAAALVIVLLGLFAAASSHAFCDGRACNQSVPVGPGGEAVTDSFFFVHQPLDGNGSITVRVTSLTGGSTSHNPGGPAGLQPWSKAGIIIKESTRPGSAYAAMMVNGSHGVRMQYDYTGDTPGLAGRVSTVSPRWLRLTRSGDTITGYASANGAAWITVGTTSLAGLPRAVQAGLFATSPASTQVTSQRLLGSGAIVRPSLATAVFGHVSLRGIRPRGAWRGSLIGGGSAGNPVQGGGYHQAGGGFTVRGSGDIAPAVAGAGTSGQTIEHSLVGAFAGLIALAVVAAMFITAEYRCGLIRTTLTASPRRGRVLAAKAAVIGTAAYVAGLAGAASAVLLGGRLLRDNGHFIYSVPLLTEVRVVAGTAAVLAVAAVLALAIGAIVRHSTEAVAAVIVVIVLPYLLAVPHALPVAAARWLLRITPAAGFSIQQSIPQYPQVSNAYTPSSGYFPLAPWTGFAVLCGYAALALGLAIVLLRRRDA